MHLAFLIGVGLAGWAALGFAPAQAAWPSLARRRFFASRRRRARLRLSDHYRHPARHRLAGGSRLAPLGSRITPLNRGIAGDAELSLDSAIFIAATACLGPKVTAVGVAVLLTVDALVRGWRAQPPVRNRERLALVARAIYVGGLSGGLIALWARAFGVGAGREPDAWLVPALGGAFL